MSKKDELQSYLNRLEFFQRKGVITQYELSSLAATKRELAEIEWAELGSAAKNLPKKERK